MRTVIEQQRTVTDNVDALQCDLCSKVYATGGAPLNPSSTSAAPQAAVPPAGSGSFMIIGAGAPAGLLLRRKGNMSMELCPTCAGVAWDWLQERKRT